MEGGTLWCVIMQKPTSSQALREGGREGRKGGRKGGEGGCKRRGGGRKGGEGGCKRRGGRRDVLFDGLGEDLFAFHGAVVKRGEVNNGDVGGGRGRGRGGGGREGGRGGGG